MEWRTEKRKISDLQEWEQNPRRITEEEFSKLKRSIELRGFHDIIKIDTDGTIVSGHQRKRVLVDLGIEVVTVMVPDRPLTEEERKQIAIESNLHRGTFDFDMLSSHFETGMLLDMGMTKFQLDLIPRKDFDLEDSIKTPDSYIDGTMRQLVFIFKATEYDEIMARLHEIEGEIGTENHTEAFIELLAFWHDNH